MDREKANTILTNYGKPGVVIGDTKVTFSRQNESDISEIEKMSDEELIANWKRLSYVNFIYGSTSLNDMQRIDLIELEIDDRSSIDTTKLDAWFKEEVEKHEESER